MSAALSIAAPDIGLVSGEILSSRHPVLAEINTFTRGFNNLGRHMTDLTAAAAMLCETLESERGYSSVAPKIRDQVRGEKAYQTITAEIIGIHNQFVARKATIVDELMSHISDVCLSEPRLSVNGHPLSENEALDDKHRLASCLLHIAATECGERVKHSSVANGPIQPTQWLMLRFAELMHGSFHSSGEPNPAHPFHKLVDQFIPVLDHAKSGRLVRMMQKSVRETGQALNTINRNWREAGLMPHFRETIGYYGKAQRQVVLMSRAFALHLR